MTSDVTTRTEPDVDAVVATTGGPVRGRATSAAHVFLNIPYAAPPTGSNRFAEPRPHAVWTAVRDATEPGPTAPQPRRDDFGVLDMSPYFGPGWVPGDDYLTVNVWTPPNAMSCPVMVFVHGGGSTTGSTRAPLYDGTSFARDGVVLVTVNYRLGVAGFVDVPGAPRNRGLLDVLAALRWVQSNIERFGGDPANVTLFGQSAGATLVAGLVATVDSRGLFHRAIVQSGNGAGAFDDEQAERVTWAIATAIGIEPTVAAFAAVPDVQFVAVLPELMGLELRTANKLDPLVGRSPFSLVAERQPADLVADGTGVDVALMVGTNADEGNLFCVLPHPNLETATDEELHEAAAQADRDPDALIAAYRSRWPDAAAGVLRSMIIGDALICAGSRKLVEAHSRHSITPTFTYEFAWKSSAVDGQLGAAHSVEVPFVFDRLDVAALHGPRGLLGDHGAPQDLATRMHTAWINFARTGDPGWDAARGEQFGGETG